MISQVIRPICRTVIARSGNAKASCVRQAHQLTTKDKPLMDLLPIPEGPWEELHKARNAKYNIHLIAGVLFFAVSLGVASANGFLFLNAVPPPLPGKRN